MVKFPLSLFQPQRPCHVITVLIFLLHTPSPPPCCHICYIYSFTSIILFDHHLSFHYNDSCDIPEVWKLLTLVQISIEQTKVITKDTGSAVNLSKWKQICVNRRETCKQVTTGFGLTSDWLSKLGEFFLKPFANRRNAKMRAYITFNTSENCCQ